MFYTLSDIEKREYSLKQKILYFLKGLFLYFISVCLIVMIIILTDKFITEILNYPSIYQLFHQTNVKISEKYNFFIIVIFVPFIEELFFRLAIVPKRRNVLIFVFLLVFIVCYQGKYPKVIDLHFFVVFCLAVLVVLWLYFFLGKRKIETILNEHKKIITNVSIISFGLIHLGNINKFSPELFFAYPIYVLPQMSLGYFCSVLRLKFGFIWGFLFHSVINFIGFNLLS